MLHKRKVGYSHKAMPYLFAFRGGGVSQMIYAVTSQERCGAIANNRHINAKVGCICKGGVQTQRVGAKRKEKGWGGNTNGKGAVETQRNCRECLEKAKERPM